MLRRYIEAAMAQATFERLEDGLYWGEIPGFQGVWAREPTIEKCREELEDVLSGWLLLGASLGHELPVVAGIDLNFKKTA